MSTSAPSPPSLPNPTNVASQQQTYNTQAGIESQAGSNVNQSNPWGSVTYQQIGTGPNGVPEYGVTTSLNPTAQAALSGVQAEQAIGGLEGANLLGGAAYGSMPPAEAVGNATQGLTQNAMAAQLAYQEPYMNYQTTQLDTQLRNQGFDPSSPAYKQAMLNLNNQQSNVMQGFESQIEPQMFSQAQQEYMLPEELALSLGGFSNPTSPLQNLAPTTPLTIQPSNYEGAVSDYENAANQQYAAQYGGYGATMGALGQAGGQILGNVALGSILNPSSMLLLSDARLKDNIEHIGRLPNGHNIYAFNYKGDHPKNRQLGLIAQDVERTQPDAVLHDHDGIKYVDYDKAMR